LESLAVGKVAEIKVPMAKPEDLPTIATQLESGLSDDHLQVLASSPVIINLHFESHHEAQTVVNALNSVASPVPLARKPQSEAATSPASHPDPSALQTPVLSIAQGAGGGAIIGGITGAGVVVLLQGLRSTTDAFANPVVSTIGAVLTGIGLGAATGTIVAKSNVFGIRVSRTGVDLTASAQHPPKEA
jgi:hypothetical protein